ncbi:MAG TPA: 3-isopropylmalate dehydratase large subunit [Acetomicrobium flavidum]|uniref:3-isopropylmalate dehydratase large subunit n=1 Tax=Acetomicrobium flavidum TaxID=49896 RepID=UPI002C217B6D|nr:3-isopropylmalate dehydratase large subunit [Acetomicrobium flavidum]
MGRTVTEKILAAHCKQGNFKPGDIIDVDVDLLLMNDITGPVAVEVFNKMGDGDVFDKNKIVVVLDHFTPNKDVTSAKLSKTMRDFVAEKGICHFYDAGYGIEHVVLPEDGLVKPGDLVIGGDSHTVTHGALGVFSTGMGSTDVAGIMALGKTWLKVPEQMKVLLVGAPGKWVSGKDVILYVISMIGTDGALGKSLEFDGVGAKYMDMDSRFTICNMAVECGAVNGIFAFDEVTKKFVDALGLRDYKEYKSDADAIYKKIIDVDLSELEPMVAMPHLPSNARPVTEVGDIKIDQVFIGSCTNGRIKDLRIAAEIVKGKKVHPSVRGLIAPGSRKVFAQALKEGLIETFTDSGFTILPPGCGPCFGGHLGILAKGERCVSTTNRNFVGRMGDKESEVYLANPAVAAASAVAGRLVHPAEVM